MTFTLITRMCAPRELGGVDFGPKPSRVLILRGREYLLHMPGATHWSGMYRDRYTRGGLYYVRDENPRTSETYSCICECRLSSLMLHRFDVRDAIIERFGADAYPHVRVDRTLVIE